MLDRRIDYEWPHETHRQAVGGHAEFIAGANAPGQTRPPGSGQSGLCRRHSLDAAKRRALARFTPTVSQFLDLLAAAEALGRTRRVAGGLARPAGDARPARALALGRDLSGCHVFSGQKGGFAVGKTKRGKGTKAVVLADGQGIPLGVLLASATPHEVTLAEPALATVRVPRRGRGRPRVRPQRIIADRGYDSDPLRRRLRRRGIELIAPYRRNKRNKPYEDGRKLRRYRRRWKIERTFAGLQNFRRLQVRQDRILSVFQGFCHVACLLITLRYF